VFENQRVYNDEIIFNKFVERKNYNNKTQKEGHKPDFSQQGFFEHPNRLNMNYIPKPNSRLMVPMNNNNNMMAPNMWSPNQIPDTHNNRRFSTMLPNNHMRSPMMIHNNSPSMMNHFHQSPMIQSHCFCGNNNVFLNTVIPQTIHYSPQYKILPPKKKKKNDPFLLLRTAGNNTDEESNRINLESVKFIYLDHKR
jgi:hypothetical protein